MNISEDVLEFLEFLSIDVQNFSLEEFVSSYNSVLIVILDEEEIDISWLLEAVSLLSKTLVELFHKKPIPTQIVQKYLLSEFLILKTSSESFSYQNHTELEKLYMFSTVITRRLINLNLGDFCEEIVSSMYENACFLHSIWNGYDIEKCCMREICENEVVQLLKKYEFIGGQNEF